MSKMFGVPEIGSDMRSYGTYLIVNADNKEDVVNKLAKVIKEKNLSLDSVDMNAVVPFNSKCETHYCTQDEFMEFFNSAKEGNIYEIGDFWNGEWA